LAAAGVLLFGAPRFASPPSKLKLISPPFSSTQALTCCNRGFGGLAKPRAARWQDIALGFCVISAEARIQEVTQLF
jgi:hypothetical protein